jgi:putative DNA-invertase from lambdoid prophage Rac
MRALTYSRVSTSHHDQKPEVQVETLRSYSATRGWQIVDDIVDHGFSGGTDRRPGLKRLLTLVRTRKVDVVIVTKLDRLARSLRHLVSLLDEFSSLGVQFVSISDQIDLTTASGRLMLHIIGAFSEFERSLIRERTVAGLAYARSQGKKLGRPKTRDDDAILRLRARGLSYSQIQRELGVSRPSIRRALVAAGTKTSKNQAKKIQSNQGGDGGHTG